MATVKSLREMAYDAMPFEAKLLVPYADVADGLAVLQEGYPSAMKLSKLRESRPLKVKRDPKVRCRTMPYRRSVESCPRRMIVRDGTVEFEYYSGGHGGRFIDPRDPARDDDYFGRICEDRYQWRPNAHMSREDLIEAVKFMHEM